MDQGRVLHWLQLLVLLLVGILLSLAFREADWKEMLETARQGCFDYLALAWLVVVSISNFMHGLWWRVLLSADERSLSGGFECC